MNEPQQPTGNNPGQQPGGGQPGGPQGQQPPGAQPYPQSQPYPSQPYPQGQQPYPQAQPHQGPPPGYGGPQSGFTPPPGGYPPQQGQPPYGPGQQQFGYGPPGAYQGQNFPGGGAPPPPGNSRGKIIGIVLGAIALLAVIGVIIGLFTGGKEDPVVPQPPPVTQTPTPGPSPEPTDPTLDPSPEPTDSDPTSSPSQETTEPAPTETETPPVAGAIDVGNGMAVVPAAGWVAQEKGPNGVLLVDAEGRGFLVTTGPSINPSAEIVTLIDKVTEGGSDVRKAEVQTPDVHPDLQVATLLAVMTSSGGGGSTKLGALAVMSSRTADQVGFATVFLAPVGDLENDTLIAQVDQMLESLFVSQLG